MTTTRGLNITLWVFQVLLGAFYILVGGTKLFGHQPEMINQFIKLGLGEWLRYLTGAMEVSGGLLLLVPPLSGVGAMELFCVMMGAIPAHLFVLFPRTQAFGPLILSMVLAFIAWGRWPWTRALLQRFKS